MLQSALTYPLRSGARRQLLIGSVLQLLVVLVIPFVLINGYFLRVIRTLLDGDNQPPAWENWTKLFADGLRATIVMVVYSLVPLALLGGATWAAVPGSAPFEPASLSLISLPLAGVGLITGFIGLLVACYLLPAALVNLARTGRTGSAFAVGDFWPVLTDRSYAVPWLLAAGVLVVLSLFTIALEGVPVIGFVISAPILFYATVVVARLYAQGFVDSTAADGDGSEPEGTARATI